MSHSISRLILVRVLSQFCVVPYVYIMSQAIVILTL